MVGRGAARLASDQARIFDSWRCSSCANALSKNLAWRCQAGSLVSGISGESAEGGMPARKRAVSSAVTVSAARAGSAAASNMAAASVAILEGSSASSFATRQMRPRGDASPLAENGVNQKA